MKEIHAWQARTILGRLRSRATRHDIFCNSGLERCHALWRGAPHDEYDRRPTTVYFGITHRRLVFGIPYWWRTIAAARLIVGDLEDLPTGRLLGRMKHPPPLAEFTRTSEPSRVGVRDQYQNAAIRRIAFLRLVGLLVNASAALGCRQFLLMGREPLLKAIYWLPVALSEGLEYPESDGGPCKSEPDWAGTVILDEIVESTRPKPETFRHMFPAEPKWVDLRYVRPYEQLFAIAKQNQAAIRAELEAWQAYLLSGGKGRSPLATLAPPSMV